MFLNKYAKYNAWWVFDILAIQQKSENFGEASLLDLS